MEEYRKIPFLPKTIVKAIQFTGYNHLKIEVMVRRKTHVITNGKLLIVDWFKGNKTANKFDWITVDEEGVIRVYNEDEFKTKFIKRG